jgi:cysteinyl-tRNA synthetase
MTHYRSPIDFSEEKLKEAVSSLERLNNFVGNLDRVINENKDVVSSLAAGPDINKLTELLANTEKDFVSAMDDDFNAPEALSVLFKTARDVNSYLSTHKGVSLDEVDVYRDIMIKFVQLGDTLGLEFSSFISLDQVDQAWRQERRKELLNGLEEFLGDEHKEIVALYEKDFPRFIKRFIDLRSEKRKAKEWREADRIRNFLKENDIVLEDTQASTQVRVKKVI